MQLSPTISDATAEYVLVQAWKKTSNYIRQHNWFADTLDLDYTAANLPDFLSELSDEMRDFSHWTSDPLRLVPAPKSAVWKVSKNSRWTPSSPGNSLALRPLAHVSLRDQVAATALMLCIADRAETLQGDPRAPFRSPDRNPETLSYGNRLFCDAERHELRHRWGSTRLYRSYFSDYRNFLQRPQSVSEALHDNNQNVVVVQSDLSRFYDRVRPGLLRSSLQNIRRDEDDPDFYTLAGRLLNWTWHPADIKLALELANDESPFDFTRVALPQGLVSAGFWSNIVLYSFDNRMYAHLRQQLADGVRLQDVSRYVDDLRLVLTSDAIPDLEQIEEAVIHFLAEALNETAPQLQVSRKKTRAAIFRGDERPIVRQSRRMERIQSAVSGGFDAAGGEEIIEAIQGLMRIQKRLSADTSDSSATPFRPVPDVADPTVARFGAARFRSTYRSLRPLLSESVDGEGEADLDDESEVAPFETSFSQADLDDAARVFAFDLVQDWIDDPSNVRLLRIGLDVWPDPSVLKYVLDLIRPHTMGARRGRVRSAALYCLAEVLRAAATETGVVSDVEALPKGLDLEEFRSIIVSEARRLLAGKNNSLPWYLKQQAYLVLAVHSPETPLAGLSATRAETKLYRDTIRFLHGHAKGQSAVEFARLAILVRRSILNSDRAVALVAPELDERRYTQIARRDPAFALELRPHMAAAIELSSTVRYELAIDRPSSREEQDFVSLADHVLDGRGPQLRSELGIASFCHAFVRRLSAMKGNPPTILNPSSILIRLGDKESVEEVDFLNLKGPEDSLSNYSPPSWCSVESRWRFQLGYLVRFILSENPDFTVSKAPEWRQRTGSTTYRPTVGHWLQRHYSLYNGHEAFGDDWLPISRETEEMLYALLAWPGSRATSLTTAFERGLAEAAPLIAEYYTRAVSRIAKATGIPLLALPEPVVRNPAPDRPLRGCVIQTVIPGPTDLQSDLEMSSPTSRKRHRNHLSSALRAVVKMLELRETHQSYDGRLDWLILPELSVHPDDVSTHLIPFSRKYHATILAGLTYEQLAGSGLLVNSAYWIIPTINPSGGLSTIVRRQGKAHLAQGEIAFNTPLPRVRGFRPAQWLVPYPYSGRGQPDPLWLTASICYDATDLDLAADLRKVSDVYAIPALNKDVTTFDLMAGALHYHMFQMVIIANNGAFGGSSAYMPKGEQFQRQVFHTHGQPQASISFFEIDQIREMKNRKALGQSHAEGWKYPPAGL